MDKSIIDSWITLVAKKNGAGHILGIPRTEWYGGKGSDDTISLSYSGGPWCTRQEYMETVALTDIVSTPWLIVVGTEGEIPDAVLCIDQPTESLAKSHPHPGRRANLIRDFRVVWKKEEAEAAATNATSLALSMTENPVISDETRAAAYRQLLADAELILYAATQFKMLPPITFLTAALEAWRTNPAWNSPRDDLITTVDARLLRLEFVLTHLRQAQAHSQRSSRRGIVSIRVSLREWWAAMASIPWAPKNLADPDPIADDDGHALLHQDQRDLFLAPYRRIRSLQITQSEWISIAASNSRLPVFAQFDEWLHNATPSLAAEIRLRVDEFQLPSIRTTLTTTAGAPLNRNNVFQACGQIRQQVRSLADLAEYLPPCITKVREHGLANHHLGYSDEYYSSALLACIGQAELTTLPSGIPAAFGAAEVVEEAVRFLINLSASDRNAKELVNQMIDIFYPKKGVQSRPIWGCSGLRKARAEPGKISNGSVIQCPYDTNKQCLQAANLDTSVPMIYPAQFIERSLANKRKQ